MYFSLPASNLIPLLKPDIPLELRHAQLLQAVLVLLLFGVEEEPGAGGAPVHRQADLVAVPVHKGGVLGPRVYEGAVPVGPVLVPHAVAPVAVLVLIVAERDHGHVYL